MLHKHHLIIRVGLGLIQFVYGSHSRMAADLTLDKNLLLSQSNAVQPPKNDATTFCRTSPPAYDLDCVGLRQKVVASTSPPAYDLHVGVGTHMTRSGAEIPNGATDL